MAEENNPISLPLDTPIWNRFFTVSSLVLIGSRDESGDYNQAPKHMVTQLGWDNYFGFVCTPAHSTYQNIKRESVFTVTYPRPTQVLLTSLSAKPRNEDGFKPSLMALTTFPASHIDGEFLRDGYVFLECLTDRILDDFGRNSLITGRILAAHVDEIFLRSSGKDDADLINEAPLLAYLEPGRFARITQSFSFPFPSDFSR